MTRSVSFIADGQRVQTTAADHGSLLAPYLRDVVGLSSVKIGCEEGSCGACTAVIDGRAVPTCLVHVGRVDGATIATAATVVDTALGLEIATAIVEGAGLQCGFCTPGVLCEAYALLCGSTSVTRTDVATALAGHLCRCTGYVGFVRAVEAVATGGAE